MTAAMSIDGAASRLARTSAARRTIAVVMLFAVGTINFVDRQLLAVLVEPIRAQLPLQRHAIWAADGPRLCLVLRGAGVAGRDGGRPLAPRAVGRGGVPGMERLHCGVRTGDLVRPARGAALRRRGRRGGRHRAVAVGHRRLLPARTARAADRRVHLQRTIGRVPGRGVRRLGGGGYRLARRVHRDRPGRRGAGAPPAAHRPRAGARRDGWRRRTRRTAADRRRHRAVRATALIALADAGERARRVRQLRHAQLDPGIPDAHAGDAAVGARDVVRAGGRHYLRHWHLGRRRAGFARRPAVRAQLRRRPRHRYRGY